MHVKKESVYEAAWVQLYLKIYVWGLHLHRIKRNLKIGVSAEWRQIIWEETEGGTGIELFICYYNSVLYFADYKLNSAFKMRNDREVFSFFFPILVREENWKFLKWSDTFDDKISMIYSKFLNHPWCFYISVLILRKSFQLSQEAEKFPY